VKKIFAIFIVFSCCFGQSVTAEDQQVDFVELFVKALQEDRQGLTNATEKTNEEKLKILTEQAKNGDMKAQYELAIMYRYGNGLVDKESPELAGEWLIKSARQGDTEAQFTLGREYIYGINFALKEDFSEGERWLLKAASNGHIKAMSELGLQYLLEDKAETSFFWFERCAKKGDGICMSMISKKYLNGTGIPTNYRKAREYAEKAYKANPTFSDFQVDLAEFYIDGIGGEKNNVEAKKLLTAACESDKKLMQDSVDRGDIKIAFPPNSCMMLKKLIKTTAYSSLYPSRPVSQNGYVTCNTRCQNGNCYRTYSDGRQVNFQAKQKWNAFTNQFEWDSGGC
jgi:hypothetical protein